MVGRTMTFRYRSRVAPRATECARLTTSGFFDHHACPQIPQHTSARPLDQVRPVIRLFHTKSGPTRKAREHLGQAGIRWRLTVSGEVFVPRLSRRRLASIWRADRVLTGG